MTEETRLRLRAERLAAGLSRPQLAVQLGVDPSTIARWETGESNPTPLAVEAIRARFPGIL